MLGVSIVLLGMWGAVTCLKDWDYVPRGLLIASSSAFVLWVFAQRSPALVTDWLCALILCVFFVAILIQTTLWAYIQHHGERLLTGKRRKAKRAIEQLEELHPWLLILFLAYMFASFVEYVMGAFK